MAKPKAKPKQYIGAKVLVLLIVIAIILGSLFFRQFYVKRSRTTQANKNSPTAQSSASPSAQVQGGNDELAKLLNPKTQDTTEEEQKQYSQDFRLQAQMIRWNHGINEHSF